MKTWSKGSLKEVDYTYIEKSQGEHNNLDFQKKIGIGSITCKCSMFKN
jgi:hypothetical protein